MWMSTLFFLGHMMAPIRYAPLLMCAFPGHDMSVSEICLGGIARPFFELFHFILESLFLLPYVEAEIYAESPAA